MKYILTLLLAITVSASFAQFTLVKDFNATSTETFYYDSDGGFLASLGSKVFVRYDSVLTGPVYKVVLSSLTIDGTREIITLATGSGNESLAPTFSDFKVLPDNKIAFIVNEGGTTFKIMVTDGTTAGTQTVHTTTNDIYGMELLTSGLYFTGETGTFTHGLSKIDLTGYSVSSVADFGSFYTISDINKTDDNTLIFYASDPTNSNACTLYKSNGTSAGTAALQVIYTGNGVSQQTVMTKVGAKVFFFYKENGTDCCNFLWVTDGTTAGTSKLKEFNTVYFTDYEREGRAIAWNNKFYFMGVGTGLNSNNNRVLWVSDGTTGGTIALGSTTTFTRPSDFTVFNNSLYLIGYDESNYNYRLYKTDGTVAGTSYVFLKYGTPNVYAYEIATNGTYLYVAGYCTGYGGEMFRYDGVNVQTVLADGIAGSGSSDPDELYVNGNDLYFVAELAETGREVYTAFPAVTTPVIGVSSTDSYIFPNPARDQVEVKSEKPVTRLILVNMQGAEVATSNSSTININAYPSGVYQLKVILLDNSVTYHKLVILD